LGIPLNANMSRGENQLTIATLDNVSQTYKERLNQTAEDEHGLFAMSIDNGKIAELIEAQFTAQGQPIPDELQSLLGQNHVASVTMDVSLRGIEFVYTAETPNE
ncbi:MAG TPA: hypothetical protein VFM61_09990, partial [Pseudidiomarina sp.]|nr:hypothetical protein [Pseudidiomarina sp.]